MVVVVLGPAGSGKTTVGSLLASELGWKFTDADQFHSQANIEKIRRGIGLDDADRDPWLRLLAEMIHAALTSGSGLILACSALKRTYRDRLRLDRTEVRFLYLDCPREVLAARLRARRGHFAPASLLESQLATLEPPTTSDDALRIDATLELELLLRHARQVLGV